MNTTSLVAAFVVVVSGLIWVGTHGNNADWTGNRNQCVGECYENWKTENGGGIAEVEGIKQAALAAASPAALGKKYYGQCIACHGGRAEGGIGPMLAGQATYRYRGQADRLSRWRRARPPIFHDVPGGQAHV